MSDKYSLQKFKVPKTGLLSSKKYILGVLKSYVLAERIGDKKWGMRHPTQTCTLSIIQVVLLKEFLIGTFPYYDAC